MATRQHDNDSTASAEIQTLINEINRFTGDGLTAAQKTAVVARLTAIQAGNGATTPAVPGPFKAEGFPGDPDTAGEQVGSSSRTSAAPLPLQHGQPSPSAPLRWRRWPWFEDRVVRAGSVGWQGEPVACTIGGRSGQSGLRHHTAPQSGAVIIRSCVSRKYSNHI